MQYKIYNVRMIVNANILFSELKTVLLSVIMKLLPSSSICHFVCYTLIHYHSCFFLLLFMNFLKCLKKHKLQAASRKFIPAYLSIHTHLKRMLFSKCTIYYALRSEVWLQSFQEYFLNGKENVLFWAHIHMAALQLLLQYRILITKITRCKI